MVEQPVGECSKEVIGEECPGKCHRKQNNKIQQVILAEVFCLG